MFKVIVVCSLVVFANAGLLPDPHAYEEHEPAHYDFAYSVHDGHTGDVKQQQESRRGDAVQGSYSLVEPDGHKRVVHYSADAHSGFNAVVEREGSVHPQPIAHAQPFAIAHAQPVAVAHAAPAYQVSHAQPLAVAHAAPAYQVSHAQPLAVAHAAPAYQVSHAQPLAVAHAAPAYQVSHAPLAVASHGISHQSYSSPLIGHAAPAYQVSHAQPLAVAHAAPAYQVSHAPLAVASHGISHATYAAPQVHQIAAPAYQQQHQLGYASHGYGNNLASHGQSYSTISQLTHHGGYHH